MFLWNNGNGFIYGYIMQKKCKKRKIYYRYHLFCVYIIYLYSMAGFLDEPYKNGDAYKNDENEIVFTIGRMNPPTPGHKRLIKSLFNYALDNSLTNINIILSSKTDNEKNPLECEEKRMIVYAIINVIQEELKLERPVVMHDKIDNMHAEVLCMDDETKTGNHPILSKINYILNDIYNYSPSRTGMSMTLIIGKDRENDYNWIRTNLSERNPPIEFKVNSLSRTESDMSATYIRNLAIVGTTETEKEFFKHLKELGIRKDDIESIYEQIQRNINIGKKRKATEKSQLSSKSPSRTSSSKSPSSLSRKTRKTGGATKKKYNKIKKIQKKSKTHRKSKK